jgi:hypothetical protein
MRGGCWFGGSEHVVSRCQNVVPLRLVFDRAYKQHDEHVEWLDVNSCAGTARRN